LLVADDRLNLRGWNVQSLKALGRFLRLRAFFVACLPRLIFLILLHGGGS
jgi:hypothetical protein